MEEERYLSSAAFDRARRAPLPKIRLAWRAPEPPESYALDMVRAVVDSVLRSRGELGTEGVVHTTLGATAQSVAQRTVQRRAVESERETGGGCGAEEAPR